MPPLRAPPCCWSAREHSGTIGQTRLGIDTTMGAILSGSLNVYQVGSLFSKRLSERL